MKITLQERLQVRFDYFTRIHFNRHEIKMISELFFVKEETFLDIFKPSGGSLWH